MNIDYNEKSNGVNELLRTEEFESDQGKFFDESEGVGTSDGTPDQEETVGFWRCMWGQSSDHNKDAEWLKELKSEIHINRQGNISITKESVARYVKRIPNWKAPGPDLVQSFWLKHFTSLHQRIVHQLQDCLLRGNVPKWMTDDKGPNSAYYERS